MNQFNELLRTVDEAFAPLRVTYGFRRVASEHQEWGDVVVLQNETTALRVYAEPRDRDVIVQVFRLGAEHPPPLRWGVRERAARPDDGFDVLDLVALRQKSSPLLRDETTGLDPQRLSRVLQGYARFLDSCAADVLGGDFTIFKDLSRLVEERRAQRKPS